MLAVKRVLRTGFQGALAAIVSVACVACGGGPISLGGRVVDPTGSAIQKAEVSTEPETDVVVTNSRGYFVLRQRINEVGETEPIKPGVYRLVVRKLGFQDLAIEAKIEGGPVRVADLQMKPRTLDIGDTRPEELEEREVEPDQSSTPKAGI